MATNNDNNDEHDESKRESMKQQNHNSISLRQCFDDLIINSANLYLDKEVAILSSPPTSLQFYRDYVSWNRPCIIKHGFDHWPATYLWSNSYLRKKMGDNIVTIAATPNGFADAVYDNKYFVLPQQRSMKFTDFIDHLELWHDHDSSECKWNINISHKKQLNSYKYAVKQTENEQLTEKKTDYVNNNNDDADDDDYCELCNEILYCQLQNGCMKDEYSKLCDDIEMDIKWVSDALDKEPDAVNFWMGEDRSISSLHQDPYENIYCVINGTKKFILYPPTDEVYLNKIPFKQTVYGFNRENKIWNILYHPKWEYIDWINLLYDGNSNSNLKKCNKIEVVVKKGEMLYLPGLWFHQVSQNVDEFGRVIAVNFWYDINYDIKWNLLNFMKSTIKYSKNLDLRVKEV